MMCYDHRIIIMDIASVGDDSEGSRRWESHSGLSSGLKWARLKSCVVVRVCTVEGQLERRCCLRTGSGHRADRCSNMALFGALLM